ncbi:MAG: glycogen synthase GlgA [Verrucomicrobia bacterium]|nr:glycogen synthase GlgA [Verrucomicrobiota bacterium]
MRILIASSEVHPYSKTGGLADMAGALAKYLALAGHRVGVVTPFYAKIPEKFPTLRSSGSSLKLMLGSQEISAEIRTLEPAEGLTIYFIHQPDFFFRASLYQQDGIDYDDNAERFVFFSKCAAHLAQHLDWKPEIMHAHDWQAGLASLLVHHRRTREGWGTAPKTCFTIHNQAYQGNFPAFKFGLTNLPWDYFNHRGVEFYGGMNCLKAAIVYADLITTVSPRYAREIATQAFGHGLDGVLRERQNVLVGILNGVDYDEWKTAGNPFLPHPYSVDSLDGKAQAKRDLQRQYGLPESEQAPLFGTVTRLVDQKGIDIQLSALEEMLAGDMQFVLLGSGDAQYERAFQKLAARHPSKVGVRIGYDHALSHRLEAGCDFYLMPSRFEPCGLNQMYSLRYGTIPIVRATGGLDDSIIDLTEDVDLANGIKFYDYSSRALAKAIRKGLALYGNRELFAHLRTNGMTADFSWERTAERYVEQFQRAAHK